MLRADIQSALWKIYIIYLPAFVNVNVVALTLLQGANPTKRIQMA